MADPRNFTKTQWQKIFDRFNEAAPSYGLPVERSDSITLASWNLRNFGRLESREPQAFRFIASVIKRFDLVALQEIKDNLDSVRKLAELLPEYELVVSDATGNEERLGFLSKRERVRRTNLAAEIDIPLRTVRDAIQGATDDFVEAIRTYEQEWAEELRLREETEGRTNKTVKIRFPDFVGFERAPHTISFEAGSREAPFGFLAFNTHIVYGEDEDERTAEFVELLAWLFARWGEANNIFAPNFIVFGDMNAEITKQEEQSTLNRKLGTLKGQARRAALRRAAGDAALKRQIREQAVIAPFISGIGDQGPPDGSNLARNERFDQILLLVRAKEKPRVREFDVFDIPKLVTDAIGSRPRASGRRAIIRQQISDHLPVWIRLKLPDPLE